MGLATQANYGPMSIAVTCAESASLVICEFIIFLCIINNDLGLQVRVQILKDGHLVLLGLDKFNRERFSIFLLQNKDPAARGSESKNKRGSAYIAVRDV